VADADTAAGAAELISELNSLGDPERARNLGRFFKTGPGEDGEGDVFAGVTVPQVRAAVRAFRGLPLGEIDKLLQSPVHEHRSAAVIILTEQARRADAPTRKRLYDFYLAHTSRINNWDLVDISCREVVGEQLRAAGDIDPLRRLAKSDLLWDRRIAMISTAAFIRTGELAPTFELASALLNDEHDLIHKAVGWMLREAGKRDEAALERFLGANAAQMPRTALRYAIERMTPERRAYWRARN
jgi:3-methyladenine DNA glycosylase AlkD